jgi:hypothetical protein
MGSREQIFYPHHKIIYSIESLNQWLQVDEDFYKSYVGIFIESLDDMNEHN